MSGSTSTNPVAIGCKLPNGLKLRLDGKEYVLKGSNQARVIGSYGITTIPSDFWDAWSKKHEGFPPLKQNLIFAEASVSKAEARAKEQDEVKSGSEPLDPNKPAPGVEPAKS